MFQKFKKHIESEFPFLKGKKILIAISGGLDSVVLFHLLNNLKYNISLAHCNFQLRDKESDLDEIFVKNLSETNSNQIYIKKFDTNEYALQHKFSIQIAARELRYNWFQQLIETNNFEYVLTAHHADDNFETFMINLSRGSGLDGFTGIPKMNGNIIRPLLPFSREEIHQYALENKIEWREDKSNASIKYTRNKIRHQVIPILKEINPSLLDSFLKSLRNLKESQQIIKDKIDDISQFVIEEDNQITKINIDKIKQLSNPKAYLYQLLQKFNFTEWDDVTDLLDAQSGKQVFSDSHRLLKDRQYLILTEKNTTDFNKKSYQIVKSTLMIEEPIHLIFENVKESKTQNKNSIYIDKDLVEFPLKLRKWEVGDYIYPIGMKGKKKISKYYKDEKFSLLEKENTWLLCNTKNEVIWIVGHRQDRRFVGNQNLKVTLKS